ncbi:hypothetical protein ASD54_09575 [Rhizobium sp. Root149]|uniref:hypothetical protein n=1 Tax=Rhizobium sp. Root149 TaxID=1736473 RepID=UPI000712BD3C|nr:hypothetical protein [Rhizobium sp. Root149]KQZ50474.1 hypothetical protein ASD54_09575 [Rhizobium sp. Root149]
MVLEAGSRRRRLATLRRIKSAQVLRRLLCLISLSMHDLLNPSGKDEAAEGPAQIRGDYAGYLNFKLRRALHDERFGVG